MSTLTKMHSQNRVVKQGRGARSQLLQFTFSPGGGEKKNFLKYIYIFFTTYHHFQQTFNTASNL